MSIAKIGGKFDFNTKLEAEIIIFTHSFWQWTFKSKGISETFGFNHWQTVKTLASFI